MSLLSVRLVLVVGATCACASSASAGDTGACCFKGSFCFEMKEASCIDHGGTFQGAGTSCDDPAACPAACCLPPDVACDMLGRIECAAAGGHPFAFGSDCESTVCQLNVCCLENYCEGVSLPWACDGHIPPPGSICADCVRIGACCLPSGLCTETVPGACVAFGGVFQGAFTSCEETACAGPGVCCLPGGVCLEVGEAECATFGGADHHGPFTRCATFRCPATCPADFDGDDHVDGMDMIALIDAWGTCSECQHDLDDDGEVALKDLLVLLLLWGECP
jgi:hypothetical protein